MKLPYLRAMKWKLVIFDLDGTLVDTIDDLGEAVNHALSLHGLPVHGREEYKKMVGNGVRNLVWRAMPLALKDDEALTEAVLADFMKYYRSHITVHSAPYEGLPGLLRELQEDGVKLAVASNKFIAGTQALVDSCFPGISFVSVLGGRDGVPLKPDPRVVSEIIRTAGVNAEDTVMVGDSAVDTTTASNGGIRSIAVTWGFRPEEAAAEADYVADSAEGLRKLLLGENH